MPILKSIQSGNFTDSTTWAVVDSGSYTISTTILNLSTSILSSSNFTVSSNITISGVLLRVSARALTPSGTLTLSFRNVTTSTDLKTVTINVSDIPPLFSTGFGDAATSCWVFFKFDSAITLSTTQTYQLRANTSVGNMITIYSNGSVFDKGLVTTTNAAPIASDTLIINGENTAPGVNARYTVTMNVTSSATAYGDTYVDLLGTLRWADTPGSTFHLRLVNNLEIRANGEVIIGDETTPIPANTNCRLEITCSSPLQFRINIGGSGKLITRGANTTVKTEINGNILSGATSFVTSTTTNWSVGDNIVIAGTSRVGLQNDVLTITGITGNTIATSTPFLFPHLGTGDTVADVGKLNRNVRIFSTSPTNPTNIFAVGSYGEININQTELFDLGHTGSAASQSAVNATSVSLTIRNSVIYNATARSSGLIYYDNNTISVLIENNFMFRTSIFAISNGRTNTTLLSTIPLNISNNLAILTGGFSFNVAGNFSGNTVCGGVSGGNVGITLQTTWFSGTMDNTKLYTVTRGLSISDINVNNLTVNGGITINNLRSFRNSVCGIQFNGAYTTNLPLTFVNARLFGNARSIDTNGSIIGNYIFRNSFFWGGSGEVSTNLILRQGANSSTHTGFYFDNCRFGVDYAGNVSNFSSAIILLNGLNNTYFNNCLFSGTEASTPGVPIDYFPGYVSINHNQVPGAIRTFKSSCILTKDTSITLNGLPTLRIAPQSATLDAIGDPVKVAIKSGQTLTISVRVRKSAAPDTAYNGTQPRLVYLLNPSTGNHINTSVVSATTANGVWETLSYTTPIINVDTVLEFYVACNGTAGFINVSDWDSSLNNNSKIVDFTGVSGLYTEPDHRFPIKNYAYLY